ncbi:kinase-like domain-containing protein [Mucor mucedo]|uniref:kinase-like domain-containing protein n=1 Tax=Mucor mucedo TaxID=29922 RepID=UPI00221F9787|nr:kinase-like domain-containing protein [Mucor mucedo]KAI7888765.1 kinase-like domain-containing protein [Mucor mucedo]
MAQPLHNPLSFLKSANLSSSSLERTPSSRSRSGSFLRAISLHPSVSPNGGQQSPTTPLSRTNTNNSLSRVPPWLEDGADSAFSCNPDDFEIKNPIGYGSSAVVYNAIYKPKGMRIAIKMIDLDLFERNQIDELRRETALMALSKHPNVLKVYGSFVNGSKLYIATPYLSGGSCLDIMKCGFKDGFEETIIATILKQTLEGLVYLHKNNHIHRDVKAGNLLMDDGGTVLLADFGVSSSLTENNEVRKTFVGTPCWMAPEVMEQSAYDFKADIWSFGITALELATGHAPFAKFPPMKVLMMTLNQSPPTLDRDHTKYKYTRALKEMIDLCLHKDPNKRPTAEKLLFHPFFKQAKRKDYLIKTVLACVPPLDQRPHRKIGFKHVTIEHTDQWDFDTATTDDETTKPVQKQQHISFGNLGKGTDLPSPAPSESDHTRTRKSRFVIEDGSTISLDKEDITVSSRRSLSPSRLSSISRETIPQPQSTSVFPTDPVASDSQAWQSAMGLGLGISSTSSAISASLQQLPLENVQVRKGRFSVNHQSAPASIRTADSKSEPTPILLPELPASDIRSMPMSRGISSDSMKGERKSRFEVQHLPSSTVMDDSQRSDATPMTREPSFQHQRTLSRESVSSGKISRFSIEKEDANGQTQELIHPFESTSNVIAGSPEYRKKGRFELTGGMTTAEKLESPQTTLNSTSNQASIARSMATKPAPVSDNQQVSSVYGQMEALLKQTEAQKTMLHDLLFGLNTLSNGGMPQNIPNSRTRSSSFDIRKMSVTSSSAASEHLSTSHHMYPMEK